MKPRVIVPLAVSLLAFLSSHAGVASLIARSNDAAGGAAAQVADMFLPYVAFPVGSAPEAVAIGDLNSDGLDDVALVTSYEFHNATASDFSVFVFLQERSGQLRAPRRYHVGGSTGWVQGSIDIGDLNGDGRDDIVVGRGGSGIAVMLQNASGTLNSAVVYATPDWRWVRIGDFNSDGRNDVAAVAWGRDQGGVSIFTYQPNGTFAVTAKYPALHSSEGDPDVGDVNGDGRDDLVVSSRYTSTGHDVFVYLQQPGGWLSPARAYDLFTNDYPDASGVGDVNGDGRDDVAFAYGYPDRVVTWLQDSMGMLGALSLPMPAIGSASAVEVADLDADGRREVVVARAYSYYMAVFWQATDGALSAEELYRVPSETSDNAQAIAVGDINGDGVNDIVLANQAFGLIVIPRNPERSAPSRIGATAAAAATRHTVARFDQSARPMR